MTTNNLHFELLGLSEKEKAVCLTLIDKEELVVSEISKRLKLNRTALYPVLEKLQDKGLIIEKKEILVKKYSLVTYKDITKIIKQRIEQLKELNNEMPKDLKKKESNTQKGLELYKGEQAIMLLANMVANSKGDVLYLGGLSGVEHILDEEYYYQDYLKKRRKNLDCDYMITDHTKSTIGYYFKESEMFTKRRFLPTNIKANGCVILFQNKCMIVQYKPSFQAIVFEDNSLIEIMKMAWGTLWKDLEGKNLPSSFS